MRAGYQNIIDNVTLIPSSESSDYPVTNLQIPRMSRTWRPLLVGPSTIEIPGEHTASLAVVNAHNATVGDSIQLKGYSDSARTILVTTIDFDIITYGTAKVFDEQSLYWTFEFNTASIFELGGLFLGEHDIFPSYEIGHRLIEHVSDSSAISFTRQLYGANNLHYRAATFLLPSVEIDTEGADLKTMWHTVGKYKPFYLLQYPDRQDRSRVFFCRFTMDSLILEEHEKNISLYKDVTISIEELF